MEKKVGQYKTCKNKGVNSFVGQKSKHGFPEFFTQGLIKLKSVLAGLHSHLELGGLFQAYMIIAEYSASPL